MKRNQMWEKVNNENAELLISLWERWQDEKEYEDIGDYLKHIQQSIDNVISITKRPFGIKIKCDDGLMKVDVMKKGNYLNLRGSFIQ